MTLFLTTGEVLLFVFARALGTDTGHFLVLLFLLLLLFGYR